jgi:serine/threonine protein phosphatase 1
MATVAIGDVHGFLPALADVLGQITEEVGPGDTVVFLGDYVDRGPGSKQCVDAILDFRQNTSAAVVCLRGNHEDWLLRTLGDHHRHSWLLGMEAFQTIRSYSPEAEQILRAAKSAAGGAVYMEDCTLPYDALFDAMPRTHLEFFQSLLLFHRTADCLCVHAGIDPRVPADEPQQARAMVWGVNAFPDRYTGAETIVYGHRNNADLDEYGWPGPRFTGNTIGIDTISHGVLTAIRLPDGCVFQSGLYARRDPWA